MRKFLLLFLLCTLVFPQTPFEELRERNKEKFAKKYDKKLELIGDTSVYLPETKPNWDSSLEYFNYEDVINEGVQNVDKVELYNLAMRWVVQTFNSANDVVQLSDKDSGNIIVKGNLSSFDLYPGVEELTLDPDFKDSKWSLDITIPITLDIKTKNGRYKYKISIYSRTESGVVSYGGPLMGGFFPLSSTTKTFTNLDFNEYTQTVRSKTEIKFPIDYYDIVDKKVQSLITSLQLSILNEALIDNDDDW